MLPVVAGIPSTRRQIFLYSLPMAAAAVAPWLARPDRPDLRRLGRGAQLRVRRARRAASSPIAATEPAQMAPEKKLFAYSVFYLFALFAVLVADRWLAA